MGPALPNNLDLLSVDVSKLSPEEVRQLFAKVAAPPPHQPAAAPSPQPAAAYPQPQTAYPQPPASYSEPAAPYPQPAPGAYPPTSAGAPRQPFFPPPSPTTLTRASPPQPPYYQGPPPVQANGYRSEPPNPYTGYSGEAGYPPAPPAPQTPPGLSAWGPATTELAAQQAAQEGAQEAALQAEVAALDELVAQKQAQLHGLSACVTQMMADLTSGTLQGDDCYTPDAFLAPQPPMPMPIGGYSISTAMEASRTRRSMLGGNVSAKARIMQQRNRQVVSNNERTSKGIDLCILMDITGSMRECIEAMKQKCLDIYQRAPELHPGFGIRVAFVGYRDYNEKPGVDQFVVHEFVDAGEAGSLRALVSDVRACGGGDVAEDVAGGLQKAVDLNWQSSTRLLIHFGDAPCHGIRYHGGKQYSDNYPKGDPLGLLPEDLLQQLITKRVDYYFARIGGATDGMVDIFKAVYEESQSGAAFEIMGCKCPTDDFIPLVLKSVSGSVSRAGGRANVRTTAAAQKMISELPVGLYS